MKSPKQKAKELVSFHKEYIMPHHDVDETDKERDKALLYFSKKAAEVSANTAIEALEDTVYGDLFKYYVEVKKEISKL